MTGVWHSPLPSFSFPRTQICVARVHICFAPWHCNIFSCIFVVICVFIFLFSCIFVFIVVVSCQCRLSRTSSRLHLRAPSVFLPFFDRMHACMSQLMLSNGFSEQRDFTSLFFAIFPEPIHFALWMSTSEFTKDFYSTERPGDSCSPWAADEEQWGVIVFYYFYVFF